MVTKYPVNNGEVIDSDDMNQAFYQGFLTAENLNYDNVNVTDNSTLIVDENADRLSILIRNNSDNEIRIGFNDLVTVTDGVILIPGESVYLRTRSNIYGIGSESSNDVRFLEVTL